MDIKEFLKFPTYKSWLFDQYANELVLFCQKFGHKPNSNSKDPKENKLSNVCHAIETTCPRPNIQIVLDMYPTANKFLFQKNIEKAKAFCLEHKYKPNSNSKDKRGT